MDIKDKTQKEMEIREAYAVSELARKSGIDTNKVSMRNMRPTDLVTFTAGTSGTSKTVGENDLTYATGTTENSLTREVPTSEYFVVEGLYLPAVTGVTTNYVAIYIGDAKQRWYRGARVTAEPNSTLYFDDPLVVKGGDRISVRFLTSAASATHPMEVLGKVFKAQS